MYYIACGIWFIIYLSSTFRRKPTVTNQNLQRSNRYSKMKQYLQGFSSACVVGLSLAYYSMNALFQTAFAALAILSCLNCRVVGLKSSYEQYSLLNLYALCW